MSFSYSPPKDYYFERVLLGMILFFVKAIEGVPLQIVILVSTADATTVFINILTTIETRLMAIELR